ncbi:hypothetical protein C3B54_11238 [Pontimonas salivibrio]|uniref:Uncharacterized protein n=1 Tax=Pontimonas salivibrio TaxID=1159327 RepID=A0A2L2BNI9_9MICO|nr:hypothetical protein C3B54_11238 [Pontimonas salivibrio]
MSDAPELSPSRPDPLTQVGWFTWTSPVGVGVGLVSVGVFLTLVSWALRILAQTPY